MPSYSGVWTLTAVFQAVGQGNWPVLLTGDIGLFGGGETSSPVNTIDYIAIATTGNATDFGDLTQARRQLGACSSSTLALFAGGVATGNTTVNTIDYVTIKVPSNATDFGDLTVARGYVTGCSSSTRGVFGGGVFSTTTYNVIDYVTIASASNATDFGDLLTSMDRPGACSNGHGGLQ